MSHALLRGDHHVHSTFSDDAVSTLAENVAAASAAGLTTVRLVDHVRQSTPWVPEYLAAVRALRVPEDLTVLTGVEAKILDASGELDIPELPSGIDRILIADHQFPGIDGPLGPSAVRERLDGGWAAEDALDQLVSALIAAMRRHPGNQLAHCFSILPKIGLSEAELGADRITAWATTAAETDTQVEVNEKWGCPGIPLLDALRSAGAEIVASTDSHIASDVGRYARVTEILDRWRAS
ncbi:PHP domain-containing protein [Microbacterium sp. CFBP9023]|uniref:PHP domain-containing protein n=1 Tax=unclassified Microbacterium TaxID=2609290 RepID=UPI002A6ADF5E|nr:PHP domain-containing protein [Microbacterium sp. CFBP9023]MDY0985428.1 PHP domain-containing protein [Microbacterium sp. CFBP9023]